LPRHLWCPYCPYDGLPFYFYFIFIVFLFYFYFIFQIRTIDDVFGCCGWDHLAGVGVGGAGLHSPARGETRRNTAQPGSGAGKTPPLGEHEAGKANCQEGRSPRPLGRVQPEAADVSTHKHADVFLRIRTFCLCSNLSLSLSPALASTLIEKETRRRRSSRKGIFPHTASARPAGG
jgi:hypothetical protein